MQSKPVALITGATGFIGSHLARRLVSRGWQVHALVRASSSLWRIEDVLERMTLHYVDGEGQRRLWAGLGQVDVVFHLATAYGRAEQPPSAVLRSNVLLPLEVLEMAVLHEVALFVSTDTPFTLDYPYLRTYTLSKRQFVDWARILGEGTRTKFVNLVLQHPYGPHDSKDKFVPWLIGQCLANVKSIDLTAGLQEKDFIFVADVVAAYETLANHRTELPDGCAIVQCGSGKTTSVKDFALAVHRLTHSTSRLNFGALQDREGEVQRSVADIDFLQRLGWHPKCSLEEGLEATVATEG